MSSVTPTLLGTATDPLRVFLVEDSPLIRERLERMLGEIQGTKTVGTATGANDAIREILNEHPDVVVLDIRLAQGSGFDVLRAVHEHSPDIDVFMLTSFPTEPYRRLAERLGAREFIDKSTDFERVRTAVTARARCGCH